MPLTCGNFWPYRRAKPPGLQANSSAATLSKPPANRCGASGTFGSR
jgi:hypothetical protein